MKAPILMSYLDLRRLRLASHPVLGSGEFDLFVDSGAFSVASGRATVNADEYADWLIDNAEHINLAATLDVIGDGEASLRNDERMRERVGDRVFLVPTYHIHSPFPLLDECCRRSPLIALGGIVRYVMRSSIIDYCQRIVDRARDNGSEVHLFGNMNPRVVQRVPLYSADSTYWKMPHRQGTFMLLDRDAGNIINVRSGKPLRSMREARVLRQFGLDPARVTQPRYGLRRKGVPQRQSQEEIRDAMIASAQTWYEFAAHRRALGHVVTVDGIDGDGYKNYLATNTDQIRYLKPAWKRHHEHRSPAIRRHGLGDAAVLAEAAG
jgi:hypothetical protein